MKNRFFLCLVLAALCLVPAGFCGQTAEPKQIEADEALLKAAKVPTDDKSLLEFLRKRTLTEDLRERAELLVAQLGASSFKDREHALTELIAKGPAILDVLRQGASHPDREVQRRCEICIQKIKDRDSQGVPAAVIRLLAARQPDETTETILAYLQLAENDGSLDESIGALSRLAVKDEADEKAILAAISDKLPIRRGAAGEALVLAGRAENLKQIKTLLQDADATVRWRIALALTTGGDKDAVAALIDLIPDVSCGQAWVIEDLLYRLVGQKAPPGISLGTNEAGRKKCRDAWKDWWKENSATVDLAVLKAAPRLLGVTTIILLDKSMVIEVDDRNNVLWQISDLQTPLDIQVLGNRPRILIAEHDGHRVTERDFKGEVLWQYPFTGIDGPNGFGPPDGPIMAQRLPNGNTFISGKHGFLEINPEGTRVGSMRIPGGDLILKCSKLENGEVICLVQDRLDDQSSHVVRYSSDYKTKIKSFRGSIGKQYIGGRIQGLANGNVLIPHFTENKVVEYDRNGKVVWQVSIDQPIVATRLPTGNTLVTSMNQCRAVEFDRGGQELWQFEQKDTKVTRALRR